MHETFFHALGWWPIRNNLSVQYLLDESEFCFYGLITILAKLEGYSQNLRLGQNLAISKKSTVFVQRLWNLVKIINPWVGNIGKISAELDQKCRFFINANIFGQSQILGVPLYLNSFFVNSTDIMPSPYSNRPVVAI